MQKQKGFTLIELLVVVAIIGVLAAVGVVAFNGFINNAKINTVKANHKSVVKYIQTEFMKCDYGGEIDFHERWKRGEIEGHSYLEDVNCQRINTTINQSSKMTFMIDYIMGFLSHYDVMGFTNPFNPNWDNGTGVQGNHDCAEPNSETVGEVNCGWEPGTTTIHCCTRFGNDPDDILQTYIQDPFI